MIDVVLLGSSGMRPLPDRGLSSLLIRYEDSMILFDCGEGTQVNFMKSGIAMYGLNYLFITHLHADHVLGFPGIIATLMNLQRTKPLQVFGPPGTRDVLTQSLRCLHNKTLKLPFQIQYYEFNGAFASIDFKRFRIDCFKVDHTVACYGYVFNEIRPQRFDTDKVCGIVPEKHWGLLQSGFVMEIDGKEYSRYSLFGPDQLGIKIAFVTDTRPTKHIARNVGNADLLVMEGMYLTLKGNEGLLKNKHMAASEAVDIANECNAERLWLTHYSPAFHPKGGSSFATLNSGNDAIFGCEGMRLSLSHSDIIQQVEVRTGYFNKILGGCVDSLITSNKNLAEGAYFKILEMTNGDSDTRRVIRAKAISVSDVSSGVRVVFEKVGTAYA